MKPDFDPRPVVLEGTHVRLEPLSKGHAADLLEAGREERIWRYMPRPAFEDLEDVRAWIAETVQEMERGEHVAFAIVDRSTGRAVGSTRYLDLRRKDRAVEIGWTWLTPAVQRTAINTECKYLLLQHAFETLGAIRVQLKTDGRNQQSQRAIERLGAVREGVLRRHMVLWDGYVRDTVYYSILDAEWASIEQRLRAALDR